MNVGQVSIVPLNPEQLEISLHPVVPVQTHPVFHVVQAALVVAVVLAAQVLAIQAVVAVAPATLSQGPLAPPVNV